MPLPPPLLTLAAFAAAAGLAAAAAPALVRAVEDRSVAAVAGALAAAGHDWAEVGGDGLQVVLEGEAPSEAGRFRALSVAGGLVDASRVIDAMRVTPPEALAPPLFAIEVLRNDGGVSVIGLLPASTDRDRLGAALREAAGGQAVSDLLQAADHEAPAAWAPALDYALAVLPELARAKVSVRAGHVAIEALADSPEAQARLEARLAGAAPPGLRLDLAVSAPRPVISPFTLRVRLEDGRARLDACAADTEDARRAILAAATAAGAAEPLDCRLGLGSPSPEWGAAAAQGIAGLHELGGGTLAFADAEVTLVAAPGTDRALFERVAGEIEGALPAPFSLRAELPDAPAPTQAGPPTFAAVLAPSGAVRLEGRVADARTAEVALAMAQARFGAEAVTLATRAAPAGLPPGWSLRVLAGVEALARLGEGRVVVTPDRLAVTGRSGREGAREEIAAAAVRTLGAGTDLALDVAYDAALDPIAGLPSPAECVRRIRALTAEARITFDAGSARLAAEAEPVIEAVALILRSCADLRLRIAGYTDAQGGEASNLRLSQARAEAVLAALRAERVPVGGFEALGFGEARPIADNATEAGRIANRRIEFSLIGGEADEARGGDAASRGEATGERAARGPAEESAEPAAEAPPGRPAGRPADAAGDGD